MVEGIEITISKWKTKKDVMDWAIGMAIGVSQNNIILGIGLGVAFGAGLGHIQMKKENSLSG